MDLLDRSTFDEGFYAAFASQIALMPVSARYSNVGS
jgi:hypothetical protein